MIPLRLELSNFLSYRETAVVDFSGIHLACIAGLNGAGKSSILDGMTWALFGKSRASSDDDVVNRLSALDGESASVVLDFELDGNVYRVGRRKKVNGRSGLELQMRVDDSKWKTLSESKIRETQAVIENLLRMNYDTFINASFLLQGKADEFTTKTASKRKEILADLLGVSQWEVYREAAAAQRKQAEGKAALFEGLLGDIAQELELEDERKDALLEAEKAQAIIAERLQDKEKLLEQLRRTATAVANQQKQVQDIRANLTRAQKSLADLQTNRQKRQTERDGYAAILAAADQIAADFAAYQEVETSLKGWQTKSDEYNRLQAARRPHELAIAQERSRLEQRHKELEGQSAKAATAVAERETAQQTIDASQKKLEAITSSLAELLTLEQAYQEARTALQTLQNDRALLQKDLQALQTEARKIAGLQQEQTAVADNLAIAQKQVAQLETQVAAIAEQHAQHAIQRAELDNRSAEQPRLKGQMDKLKERMDRLDVETGGECPLCGQSLSDAHRAEVLADLEAEGKELGDRFRDNKKQMDNLKVQITELEKAIKNKDKLERDLTAQRDRQSKAEARLQEIAQSLTEWDESGKTSKLTELEKQLADTTAVTTQEAQLKEMATAVAGKTKLEKEQQNQQKALANAQARLSEIEKLITEWETVGQAALEETIERLKSKEYAQEAQAELVKLDEEITAIGYDADAHQAVKKQLTDLAKAPVRHQELKQAEAAVKPLDDTLTDLDKQLTAQQEAIGELEKQEATAVAHLEQLTADSADLRAVEDEVFTLREEQIQANQQVGAAQQKLGVLDDLRQKRQQLTKDQTAATQLVTRLKMLEQACGRNGVQALLIEHALPEIEDRANELLERLTGGNMRVTFETQKQLKSRDAVAETLDIRIIDNAGERPYANFSGGEQFRVNFAVRLALSQLLARRAGASLRTLVVDEGFGSQDPNGRQRLIEAINTIQGDFDRILVITHIEELRDAFPNRIEVEKGIGGSRVTVV